ncbi:MAG: geranylgeranyl pyrophosphate synthase [Burkholderiaceae bacterium]|nr:MAG: geranylgeranyl pyrophosphate synthase [Burkholderiaceae bacterium]
MKPESILELHLKNALSKCSSPGSPKRLHMAMHHAVFPGGARIRPRLCLAIADSFDNYDKNLAIAAAVAIEFLHCASLIHDDLPCFDDANMRRGRPSVHKEFDERLAILAGDALIVEAFRHLNNCETRHFARLRLVVNLVTRSVGSVSGIIAGQAWECEKKASLEQYQREKTGALFEAAVMSGAASAGSEIENWRLFGEKLGEAYQVADDIRDVIAHPSDVGKPTGRDEVLGRMSSARELGLSGAVAYFDNLIDEVVASVPKFNNDAKLTKLIRNEAIRLVPKKGRIKVQKIDRKAFS